MTFGGVVIAAMLSAVAVVLVARINVVGKKVDTAVTQTASTGNGYADRTTKLLEDQAASLRRLHARLDDQNTHINNRNDYLDGVIIAIDGRLTYIEEKL